MRVGMAVVFQGSDEPAEDADVYRNELRLGDLAEPLGFQSIWGVEHHFTSYTMCPDVLQFLTYFAGRTQHLQLGSMVVVLPWHDPIRVAEQVVMLDHLSQGRFVLGIGRGLGRVEFEGFRVSMDESRERFVEAARMIMDALETGSCEFEGEFYRQPKRQLRPSPFKSFRGRTYAAAVSPESSRIMAELGVAILIIPQKPWKMVADELNKYRAVYRDVNGTEAPPPGAAGWVFCDESEERAREFATRYIGAYWRTALAHYELAGSHLKGTKGYEFYSALQERLSSEEGAEASVAFFRDLQIWGTPEQCYEKVVAIQKQIGGDMFNAVFSYAGMPYDEAERNMRLFARAVLPELRKVEF